MAFVLTRPLNFKPGTEEKYSNVGYIALGEVIAKVSGMPYARFVTEKVLKPMGAKKIGLHGLDGKFSPGEIGTALIPGRDADRTAAESDADARCALAAAGAPSVVDMARFLTNLDGSRGEPILSEKTRKLMVEQQPEPLKRRENGTWFGLGLGRGG